MSGKTIASLDLATVNLSDKQFIRMLPNGTELFRIVLENQGPFKPTGIATAWASEPPSFDAQGYAEGLCAGTGATYFARSRSTAEKEVEDLKGKVIWKITVQRAIELPDLDEVCRAQGISKPYMTETREPLLHQFYGKRIKGLICESRKDENGYTVVIFNDWFPDFPGYVQREKVSPSTTSAGG